MHHEDGPPGRSHWDELAEQLGLPPEGEPAPAKRKQPEPSIHREMSNRDAAPKDRAKDPKDTEAPKLEVFPPPTEATSDADSGSEDDRPGRRRRGRRGGRRHREGRESSDSDSGRRPRSAGRGEKRPGRARRSRAVEEPSSEDAPDREASLQEVQDDHDLEPQVTPTDPGETDDEEIEKISDWTIPSWAEIVSGLYRP